MITPDYLHKGDLVSLVATAKSFDKTLIASARKTLESWGLRVIEGKNLYAVQNQFAGSDAQRTEDLQSALDNENIKAIFCVRGGYGTSRIIDEIDFSLFLLNPKWVIGFSDITVLHGHLDRLGIESMHAIMPVQFARQEYKVSLEELKKSVFGKPVGYTFPSDKINRSGIIEAEVTGGNLTILHTTLLTKSFPNLKNKILFIEDVGENLYHIDRMMVHFKRVGILKELAGLVVGHFTDMKDGEISFGKNANEIIADSVANYSYPVCYNFPSGHESPNMPLIFGRKARLIVDIKNSSLHFSGYNSVA